MRDIVANLRRWWAAEAPVGLATVVDVRHSAPRPPGASMAVGPDGEVAGSVSGGCVEGAVYEVAEQVLGSGTPRHVTYGISDEEAFSVGLTCGGELDVFVERIDRASMPVFGKVVAAIDDEQPVAVATIVRAQDSQESQESEESQESHDAQTGAKLVVWPDGTDGTLGHPRLDEVVAEDARGMLAQGQTGIRHYGPDGQRRRDEVEVFVSSFAPPPCMLVFGAIDFAAAVAGIGKFLGYRVTVCDARSIFATKARFPDADEVINEWPHRYLESTEVDERTVICVLTHDPKFDVPLLERALRTEAAYIGAMGSRRTHNDRLARLKEAGVTDDELARLRSPIGLDLGARTPEEVAVSIGAEIIHNRWGGSTQPLGATRGRVHQPERASAGAAATAGAG